ncbi:MAG: hypothetical protein AB2374_01395 [Cytobacillus gottheilii]|uniref:Membrane protein YszA n=2 Tax=Cytobacillus gottheilii TaxID=859144 RepID=A0ABX8FIH7_9BACI|nr:hypothetical protein [Cytobacillus gottheilii]QVY63827.1 hypothetical protein J1899_16285 [Cytobacillus gottheilii]
MKRRYNPHGLPPWLRSIRNVCGQFIVPICIFQGIRTLILPSILDVLLLFLLIAAVIAFQFEMI